jgi:YVTN family beta-propeller protein
VNPATNKIYVANIDGNDITVIDGATNTTTAVTAGANPFGVAVNLVTNRIYVTNELSDDVTVISEQEVQSIPLITTITPLPGDRTINPMPTFNGTATSAYWPIAPPVQGVYCQLDTWQGAWLPADYNPASFSWSFTAPSLSLGVHLLYAFAADGQEATSVNVASSPIPGAVTTYLFLVTDCPEAPAGVSAVGSCSGVSVSWTASTGATTYNVLRGTTCGTVLATFTDVTSPYNDTTGAAGTPYYYWVVAVNACGTSPAGDCAAGTRRLTPEAPTAGNNGPICEGQTLNLTASTVAGAAYDWTGPNGFASALQNPTILNAATAAGGTYSVTVTVDGCTSTASSTSATVNALPIPTISGLSSNTCPTTGVTLNTETGMNNYQWYLNAIPISGATSSIFNATQSGNHTLSYQNANGCSGTSAVKAVTITVCVPNVFYDALLDPNTTLFQLCGDGDGQVEPGEEWRVTVRLKNTGDGHSTNTMAVLAVNAGSAVAATITGNPASFGTVSADGGTAATSYHILVDSGAACVNDMIFDVTDIQSTEGTYPGQVPAFCVPVGSSDNQNNTGTQVTSPLNATNSTANSDFVPVFTISAPPDSATLSYTSGYAQKPASDAVLFGPDDFADISNWTSSGGSLLTEAKCATSNPVPSDSYYRINRNSNITLTGAVSTVGYMNIRVVFDGAIQNTGARLYLDWSPDGVTWNTAWSTESLTWLCDEIVTLPVEAEGKAGFKIRFQDTGSSSTQRAKVDYVKIVGTAPAAGSWTSNARVSLVDPSNTVTVLKAYGAADGSPYNVKPYYTGPGTYQIRLEENLGGTATLTSTQMTVDKTIIQCDVSACTVTSAPPPVNNIGPNAARFTKNPDGETLQVTYDAVTCNAQKAILLYGNLGTWAGYAGCADSDLGDTGQDDAVGVAGLEDVWLNIVWTSNDTAGHPGFGYDGTSEVPRTWTVGTLCGMVMDDPSHASCP